MGHAASTTLPVQPNRVTLRVVIDYLPKPPADEA
jgi:hypothetical protein